MELAACIKYWGLLQHTYILLFHGLLSCFISHPLINILEFYSCAVAISFITSYKDILDLKHHLCSNKDRSKVRAECQSPVYFFTW